MKWNWGSCEKFHWSASRYVYLRESQPHQKYQVSNQTHVPYRTTFTEEKKKKKNDLMQGWQWRGLGNLALEHACKEPIPFPNDQQTRRRRSNAGILTAIGTHASWFSPTLGIHLDRFSFAKLSSTTVLLLNLSISRNRPCDSGCSPYRRVLFLAPFPWQITSLSVSCVSSITVLSQTFVYDNWRD